MPDPTSRPRRPPAAPSFDPAAQAWQPADAALAPVPPDRLLPELLRGALSQPGPWPQDPLGSTEYRHPGREGAPVLAAVLIPLVAHASGVRVMLTQRAAHLHDHAGQISFPGGRLETTDATPVDAALREAEEETGLPIDYVDVLGSMPAYLTSTGFSITPVLSLVRPGFTLVPDSFEVAEVFEVPLAFLMDPANHRLYRAPLPDGRERQYYAMPWQGHFIWGATAGMLRNLYHLVRHRLAANADQA
ncbi:CoA pyrophosphatase [Bordetella sp. BOR01]|uniref:CoA pyrophosphatase n=1 Tax=Bordetella sp. BOR01 TaxID=2854779 RepID=UPI001C468831|nr:CoA pyrophosphatase [Bordetella sp. BOR01]MBV7482263.1 CoA pyrophosphatase [Bordetella sp. BOR01]